MSDVQISSSTSAAPSGVYAADEPPAAATNADAGTTTPQDESPKAADSSHLWAAMPLALQPAQASQLGATLAQWGGSAAATVLNIGSKVWTVTRALAPHVAFASVLLESGTAGDGPSGAGSPDDPGSEPPRDPMPGIAIGYGMSKVLLNSSKDRDPAPTYRGVETDPARLRYVPPFVGFPDINGQPPNTPGMLPRTPPGFLLVDPKKVAPHPDATRAQAGPARPPGDGDGSAPRNDSRSDADAGVRADKSAATAGAERGAADSPAHPMLAHLAEHKIDRSKLTRGDLVPAIASAVLDSLADMDAQVGATFPRAEDVGQVLGGYDSKTVRAGYDLLEATLGLEIGKAGAKGRTVQNVLSARPSASYAELKETFSRSYPRVLAQGFPALDQLPSQYANLTAQQRVIASVAIGLDKVQWQTNKPMPPQRFIAEQIGASTSTVSSAFSKMKDFGLEVQFSSGGGTLLRLPEGGTGALRQQVDAWLQGISNVEAAQATRLQLAASRLQNFHEVVRRDGQDLTEATADGLHEGIVTSGYRPGEVLPPIADLAAAMHVSQDVVHTALKLLHDRGVRTAIEPFSNIPRTVVTALPNTPAPSGASAPPVRPDAPSQASEVRDARLWVQHMREEKAIDFERDPPTLGQLRSALFGNTVHSPSMLREIEHLHATFSRALPGMKDTPADAQYLSLFTRSLRELSERMRDPAFAQVTPPGQVSPKTADTTAMRDYLNARGYGADEVQQMALARDRKLASSPFTDPYLSDMAASARKAVALVRNAGLDVSDPLLDLQRLSHTLFNGATDTESRNAALEALDPQVLQPVERLREHAAGLREVGMPSMARIEEREAQTLILFSRQLDRLRQTRF